MTKIYRGFVIVDRPIHTDGLDKIIDFTRAGLTAYLIVQVPAGVNSRQALTRWITRNSPESKYLKVSGYWGRDTWLFAFPDASTKGEFNSFLHNKRRHFVIWQGSDPVTFVNEGSRILERARISGRVEGARNGG